VINETKQALLLTSTPLSTTNQSTHWLHRTKRIHLALWRAVEIRIPVLWEYWKSRWGGSST